MKKQLNTDAITNELEGSVFFPSRTKKPSSHEPVEQKDRDTTHDTEIPRYLESIHDTTIPRNHDTAIPVSEEDMIEAVRKAVKQIGKEPATQRLTLEEKQALDDIEYSYKRQGIRVSPTFGAG